MEIHLVFTNTSYKNTNEALAGDDGILILVYLCKVGIRKKKYPSITYQTKPTRVCTNIVLLRLILKFFQFIPVCLFRTRRGSPGLHPNRTI